MTKDHTHRTSVSGSAHGSAPLANGTDSPSQDPPQPSEPPSALPESPSPATDAQKPTDSDIPPAPAAESQPMTASNSSSSPPPNITTKGSTADAVPYGTRSRNRTGAARPNYAEDKELDMDFEAAPAAKESSGGRKSRGSDQIPASQSETGRATSSVRRAATDATQSSAVQNLSKEQIPGTSTFSANLLSIAPAVGQPLTKKRKTASASHSHTHTPTYSSSLSGQALSDYRLSNMMSFENCQSRLKDDKLVADDGTVLESNGKLGRIANHLYIL